MNFGSQDWMSLASFMAGMLKAYEHSGQISMEAVKKVLEDYEKMVSEMSEKINKEKK